MNWNRIEGNWKQVKGKVQEQWGKLTDDDFDVVGGRSAQLAGQIKERYGIAKHEAEKKIAKMRRHTDRRAKKIRRKAQKQIDKATKSLPG